MRLKIKAKLAAAFKPVAHGMAKGVIGGLAFAWMCLPSPGTLIFGPIAPLVTPLNTATNVLLKVSSTDRPLSNLTFTGGGTNGGLVETVSFALIGTNVIATVQVVSNRVGFDVVTFTVSDGSTNLTQSFALTVSPISVVQLGPILAHTASGPPVEVVLTVTDPDTSPANLAYTGIATNTSLVSGITFYFNGTNEVALLSLVPGHGGTSFITISVTDGFSTDSKTFELLVTPDRFDYPVLKASAIGNQVIIQLTGMPNAQYHLQTSLDLKTWTSTLAIVADAGGVLFFTNMISPAAQLQCFRAINR